MTVAYSAYSKANKKFVMGADNLEGWAGKIVSKIRVVLDRYAICVTGCDNTIHAFDGMVAQVTDKKELEVGWPNIHELMGDLVLWTKQYTEQQVKKHSQSAEVVRCLQNPGDCQPTVIVFDSETFELFRLEMKRIYPPEDFEVVSAKKTLLNDGVLHLHAMAKNRTNQVSELPLPSKIFLDPKKEFEALVTMDKDYHDQARLNQPDVPRIGELGSYCYYDGTKLVYVNLCSPRPPR